MNRGLTFRIQKKLKRNFKEFANHAAFKDKERDTLSYKQLGQVHASIRKNIKQLDQKVVGVWVEDRADLSNVLGALIGCCVVVPLFESITLNQLNTLVQDYALNTILTDGSHPNQLQTFIQQADVCLYQLARKNLHSWEINLELVKPQKAQHLTNVFDQTSGESVTLIFCTSGSTGEPKIVQITQMAIIVTIANSVKSLELKPGERTINVMALHHVHGLISCTLLPWFSGGFVYVAKKYTGKNFLEELLEFRPSWLSASPVVLMDTVRTAARLQVDLRALNLRIIRIGSAALSSSQYDAIENAYGVNLYECYGMSETLQISGVPFNGHKRNTLGKAIADKVTIRDHNFEECEHLQIGEICVSGRTVSPNQTLVKDKTSNTYWFKTGDLGYQCNEGYLYYSGRISDRMNIGGEIVSKYQIEELISELSFIEENVCFPIAHEHYGEAVATAIQITDSGYQDIARVRSKLIEILPSFAVPKKIFISHNLKKTESGKLDRVAIEQRYKNYSSKTDSKPICDEGDSVLENWLCIEFARILGLPTLSVDCDIFDIGATSLDIVNILDVLESKLKTSVHSPFLLNNSSVKTLAVALTDDYPNEVRHIFNEPVASIDTDLPMHADDQRLLPKFHFLKVNQVEVDAVFILSAPRSGSTLLRNILDKNEKVFAPQELRLLNYNTFSEWQEAHSGNYEFFQEGVISAASNAFKIPHSEAKAHISRLCDSQENVLTFYKELGDALPETTIVDKSPLYAADFDTLSSILERFERPRFIVLYRNPEDMINSYIDTKMHQVWMHSTIESPQRLAQRLWLKSHENIFRLLDLIDRKQYLQLHFEELVTRPNETIERVCQYLHVPFMEEMLVQNHSLSQGYSPSKKRRIVGDPKVLSYSSIDATTARSGYKLSKNFDKNIKLKQLASTIGYSNNAVSTDKRYWQKLSSIMKVWRGESLQTNDVLVYDDTNFRSQQLFWFCQELEEGNALKSALSPGQKLVFSRSAHLLCNKFDLGVREIATIYAQRINELYPSGDVILGGNCQGAYMAREVMRALQTFNRPTKLLFAMEAHFEIELATNVCHIFGSKSDLNPLIRNPNLELKWHNFYKSLAIETIDCAHGQFFANRNLRDLASIIERRMTMLA